VGLLLGILIMTQLGFRKSNLVGGKTVHLLGHTLFVAWTPWEREFWI